MRGGIRALAVSCSAVLVFATAAAAQPPPSLDSAPSVSDTSLAPLSKEHERDLAAWLTAMEKWQKYTAKWSNRPARDGLGRIAERRPQPDAPEWLAARCAAVHGSGAANVDAPLTTACRLLGDPYSPVSSPAGTARTAPVDAEKGPPHTSFLTRVHLDGLWTTAASQNRFYGIVGSHVSLVDVGRLQVFGPPGVMVLSVPDVNGSRRITVGYTWGLSVRLGDVRIFGPTKDKTLFLNVSKVWLTGNVTSEETTGGYQMMGLSIAPRKKR